MAREAAAYCPRCKAQVMVRQQTPNHILHLLLTLLTCFWGIVWAAIAMGHEPWRCVHCGSQVRSRG